MSSEDLLAPFHVFRFQVDFQTAELGSEGPGQPVPLCSGAFSECTGLEATMEPMVIREGGRNYGSSQRVGPVTFATVVLKRGMTSTAHLWKWFELVTGGGYSYRLTATVTLFDNAGNGVLAWDLLRALPVKFKAADMNAKNAEVGIEELHIVHEGLVQTSVTVESLFSGGEGE
jgi:phage tail-like protein